MTEENRDTRKTLGEMSHTNPYTGEVFGETQTYQRGRTVAADGGADPDREAAPDEEADREELRDIEHTPPAGADSANGVHQRGGEAVEDDV